MSSINTDDLPLGVGAVAGVAAWLLGFAFTYLIVSSDIRDSALNQFLEVVDGDPATYELVGWVFYNAHFVDTVIEAPVFGSSTSFIGGDNGFSVILYLIPVGLLVAAGLALSRYQGATDSQQGALAGVTVLPGYLLLSIIGVFLTEVSIGGASGSPDLVPAILLAGIAFPAVCGAVGGVLGVALSDESE